MSEEANERERGEVIAVSQELMVE
jgi:hypothetical protein